MDKKYSFSKGKRIKLFFCFFIRECCCKDLIMFNKFESGICKLFNKVEIVIVLVLVVKWEIICFFNFDKWVNCWCNNFLIFVFKNRELYWNNFEMFLVNKLLIVVVIIFN